MSPRPRICPECRDTLAADAEVIYSAAGIFHRRCYTRWARKAGTRR